MPFMPSLRSSLRSAIQPTMVRLERQKSLDQIVLASELNEVLLDAQSQVASIRRGAIRSLRADGYTLSEIAREVGMTPQRVHQLEIGQDRRDKQ